MSLTEHELDRLADYTVDELGPQDAAEVELLVRTDPRWSAAYESLIGAEVAVRADLRSIGGTHEPMPADVVTRIDAALAELSTLSSVSTTTSVSTVTSLDEARDRRRRRWRTGVGVAAAGVALVGGGISVFGSSIFPETSSPTSARGMADNAESAPEAPGAAPPAVTGASPGVPALSSGTDYRPDTLGSLARTAVAYAAQDTSTLKSNEVPRSVAESAPGPLARLTAADALATCLRAVLSQHPGTVTALDYARFSGEPALVIVVRQLSGTIVVAVGDECGLTGSDEKASVPGL